MIDDKTLFVHLLVISVFVSEGQLRHECGVYENFSTISVRACCDFED
jgi:hypothetical protein